MYAIVRDQPGQALELEWKGVHPALYVRLFYTFTSAMVIAAAVAVGFFPHACLVLALWPGPMVLLLPWALNVSYAHRMAWDKTLTLSFKGQYLLLRWTRVIPFTAIRSLKIHVEEPASAKLYLTYDQGKRVRSLVLEMEVTDLDRRDEAMDLIFRIGRIMGWPRYRVLREDPRAMEAELYPSGEGNPVPEVKDAADYSRSRAAFQEVHSTMPSFDLARLQSASSYDIRAWAPGKRVHIAEKPRTWSEAIGTAVVGALMFQLVLLVVPPLSHFVPAVKEHMGLLAGACAVAGAAWGLTFGRRRQTELDWSAATARFSHGREVRCFELGEIEELVLRGRLSCERTGGSRNSSLRTVYFCELEAILPGPDAIVLKTRMNTDPDHPYLPVLAATVELARALSVPWRWEPYR